VTKTQAAAHHAHAIVVTYGYPFCSDCCCRCHRHRHRHRHRLGMRCAFLLFLFLFLLFLFLFRPWTWTWGTASCCHRRLVSWVTWSDDACRRYSYRYRRCEMIFVILLLPQGWGCVIAHAPPSPVPQLALTDLAALL